MKALRDTAMWPADYKAPVPLLICCQSVITECTSCGMVCFFRPQSRCIRDTDLVINALMSHRVLYG